MTVTKRPLNVGLIGLGPVGSQVADRMLSWGPQLSRRAGVELCLKKVLVRDVAKRRAIEVSGDLLTADASELLDDRAIEVVIEVAGGDEPVRSYLERAIQSGKHVITANKVVMAKHGPQLLDQAAEKNVDVYFEAAVGGGIAGTARAVLRYAREPGDASKLAAQTQGHQARVEARVHRGMVPLEHPLARVEGAETAVYVEGDLVAKVLLLGQGAGGRPTA